MKSAQTLSLLIFSLILITPSRAIADVVTDWNTAALNAIRANRTSPPEASRTLAILHVAIYDAINGIDRRHEPYFVRSEVQAGVNKEAAGSAAAHRVLVTLFPNNALSFNDLAALVSTDPDGNVWVAAVEFALRLQTTS